MIAHIRLCETCDFYLFATIHIRWPVHRSMCDFTFKKNACPIASFARASLAKLKRTHLVFTIASSERASAVAYFYRLLSLWLSQVVYVDDRRHSHIHAGKFESNNGDSYESMERWDAKKRNIGSFSVEMRRTKTYIRAAILSGEFIVLTSRLPIAAAHRHILRLTYERIHNHNSVDGNNSTDSNAIINN